MEESKLTGMIVTDLRREIAEQYKEIESLKKENEGLKTRNQELERMLEIATSQLREIKNREDKGGE